VSISAAYRDWRRTKWMLRAIEEFNFEEVSCMAVDMHQRRFPGVSRETFLETMGMVWDIYSEKAGKAS
jgi:hypothetical protein